MQPFVEKKEENIRRSKSNFQLHFAAGWSLIYKRIFRSTDSGNWYFFIQVVLLHLRYFVWLHFLYFVAFCCVLLYLRHFVVLLYLRHCCILLYLRHFVALLYLWHCCILLYLRHDQLSRFESSQFFFCPVFCASTKEILFFFWKIWLWNSKKIFLYLREISKNPFNLFRVQSFALAVTYKGAWFQYQLHFKYWSLKYGNKYQSQLNPFIHQPSTK